MTLKQLPLYVKDLIKYQQTLASMNGIQLTSWQALGAGISTATKAMLKWLTTTPVGWATLAIGAIAGVVGIYDLLTTSMEEASEATIDAIGELSSITSEVETLEGKLADLKAQIDGLDPITDEEDIRRLEAESLELENQLAILKEKQRLATEDADEKAQESLGKKQASRYNEPKGQSRTENGYVQESFDGSNEVTNYQEVTREEELKNAMNAYDEYYKQRLALEAELAKMSADDEGYKEKENQINLLNQQMKDARTHASELALALDEEKDGLSGTTAESKALLDSTNATLSSYNQWLNGINGTTNALNENANAIDNVTTASTKFTKTQMIDTINSMADGFDILDDIYADVLDGETFDFTKLDTSKFSEAFSEITPEYEKFIETVSSSPTDIEACQGAFNDLVSAFIDSKGILESVDEETKQLTIDMLENMGVVNAKEVVMSALNAKLNEFADAKSVCALAGVDFANATRLEILELMREQEMSEETRISLWRYQMQKALSNENGINTVYDCVQLENLARAAGYTGSALIYLGKIKALLNKIENDKLDEDSLGYESVMGQVKNYNGLLQQLLSTEVATTKATVNYGGATKTAAAAQDKLKDSTKKATDALEKQKEALEEQKSELEELYDAVQWFYDTKIDKIDDTIDKINEEIDLLEKQQETMDDIIKAIENNYDYEISLIQDKIDALKDANDEEKKALKLEEAKRKLQEAKSRKTLMVYTKNAGVTYQVDTSSIKEAESELAELQENEVVNELEKQIDALEEAKEKWSQIPDAYNKAMQEIAASNYFGANWKDITLLPSDELLANFKGKYTGIQSSIDSKNDKIDSLEKEKQKLEELKSLWEDAKNSYRNSQYEAQLASFFGSDYEYQLLNNSAVWRRKFADEYSSICAEIEALEERIKTSSETTTSSVESGANRISNAANGVKDSMDSMKQSYKWTEADTADLDFARARLEALNTLIGQGRTELTDARDKVAAFVEQYAQLEDSRIVTDNLKSSVSDLNGIYSETDTLFNDVLEGVDGRLSSMSSYVQEVDSSSQTLADNLSTASQAIQEMKTSEETIEAEAEETVSNVETTISNLLTKLGELQTKLGEISLSRTEIEAIADEELLDTSIVVDGVHTKVGEIQTAITTLMESITPLEGALDALMQKLTTLDEVTLSNVISAFGGASGGEGGESKESGSNKQSKGKKGSEGESGGGSGLLGAVKAVDEAIGSVDNEESLLGKLAQVDASTLENIIAQFGLSGENGDSEGANLLNAVNAVSTAIVGGGKDDENSLIASIEQLGSDPTIEHVTNVTESFNGLLETINNCIIKLENLASNITSLPSVSVDGYASGTRNAKKGLHEIAEEGAEIISDGTHAVLAQTPTLMNMKGGETVYNAKETEKILNGEGLKPIDALENYTAIREGVEIKRPEWILGDDDKTFTFAGRQITMKEFNALSEQLANRIQNTYPTFHRDVLNSMAVNKPFDYGNVPMNNGQQQTFIQINGDLSFPNIKSGNDAELLLKDLSNMANKARQRSARR